MMLTEASFIEECFYGIYGATTVRDDFLQHHIDGFLLGVTILRGIH